VGGSAGSSVDPVRIEPREPVPESDAFGVDEAQAGIGDLEILSSGLDAQLLPGIHGAIVHRDLINNHCRRLRVYLHLRRIDDRNRFRRREPQPAVGGSEPGGLVSAIALLIEHPVALAVGNGRDLSEPAFGELVEFILADSIDAQVTADPEVAAGVFEYLKHAV